MKAEGVAKHRAAVLRPILEIEKKGGPISSAIGDAAWELGLAKSYTWKLYRTGASKRTMRAPLPCNRVVVDPSLERGGAPENKDSTTGKRTRNAAYRWRHAQANTEAVWRSWIGMYAEPAPCGPISALASRHIRLQATLPGKWLSSPSRPRQLFVAWQAPPALLQSWPQCRPMQ